MTWRERHDGRSKAQHLVIWGDDIGVHNISAYNHGMMGYRTPNIDRIAARGRAVHRRLRRAVLHRRPRRVHPRPAPVPHRPADDRHAGLAARHPDWTPTIADLLKQHGYTTGQFGKNHLGDRDKHLPTAHGFDEFFGNLYHLNAEEEPEGYYYPKDPEFRKQYGPRGVLHTWANGTAGRGSRTPAR